MHPIAQIALVIAVAAGTSLAVTTLVAPASNPVAAMAAPATSGPELAVLKAEIGDLRHALADHRMALDRRLEGLTRQPAGLAPLATNPTPDPVAATPATATAAATPARSALPAQELLSLLESGSLTSMEREELWNELAKAGRTKELIALFEARAASSPSDPDLQVELGGAYLRMLQEVGQSALAGVWAGKADSAFDRALELDPRHADARLSKAISLSFWPPIFGKQAEAVKQFETLIGQLEGASLQPNQAQAWLMLGNLHQQQGKTDAALAVWKQGSELFPSDPSFAEKLKQP